MKSFQDLGLSPTLAEALTAEGLIAPFELQRNVIPLIARNNNLLIEAGPGSGTLIAYIAPLLENIEPGTGSPGAIILTPTRHASSRLAEYASRLSISTGHSVGALGGNWASPESSDILFGTPHDLLSAINSARLTTHNIGSLVIDGANSLEVASDFDAARELLGYIGNTTQKVIFSLPITDSVKQMVSRYVPKCLEITDTQKQMAPSETSHNIHHLITTDDREKGLLSVLTQHLSDTSRHLMIFVHTDDRVADVIEFLRVYGFTAGAPGDIESHIWVGTDDEKSYSEISKEQLLATLSLDCPQDTAVMKKRHGGVSEAIVLLLPREVPHFQKITSDLRYTKLPVQVSKQSQGQRLKQIRSQLMEQISSQDLAPYYAILEPLIEIYDPIELSAASLSLASLPQNSEETSQNKPPIAKANTNPDEWTRLFVSIGTMEGVTPGTLLGALAGESEVDGNAFGKIDIRETFSLVEVLAKEAGKVIKAVNGVTIRGRSTRVDYDRGQKPNQGPTISKKR